MPYGGQPSIIINVTPVVGGTPGRILFVGSGNVIAESPNLFWDNSNNQLLLNDGSLANPAYSFASDPDSGFRLGATADLRFTTGGVDRLRVDNSTIVIISSGQLAFGSSGISAPDVFLRRGAANTFAQHNTTNAQAFNIYNTFTDASNYERGKISWESNSFKIGTEVAGSGTNRSMIFQTNGTDRWTINTNGHLVASSSRLLLWGTDNTGSIGSTGANRPAEIYVGSFLQIEANNGLKLTNQVNGAGAAAGTLNNAPTAGDPAFWIPVTINGANRFIPCWA